MACFHPLPACYDVQYPVVTKVHVCRSGTALAPQVSSVTGELLEPFTVPCGKCIGCRLDYSRQWADRCTLEALDHPRDQSWFVTLTYDDEHIPPLAPCGIHTLVPDDLSAFMKRLRERWSRVHLQSDSIRFYGAGEYGSDTFRPHYHLLLFGLELFDLRLYKSNSDGDPVYSSSELDSVWGNGFTCVAPFSWHTAAYTARYVVKKLKGRDASDTYRSAGIAPEFVRMSRKPGIGFGYLSEHFDEIIERDSIQLPQGMRCKPPKYFMRTLQESDPLSFDRIKRQRIDAMENARSELSRLTSVPFDQYLLLQEKEKIESARALRRKDI